MRWTAGILVALIVLVAVYLGSAVVSLSRLVSAVKAGDGAAVMAQTDTKALSHSLTEQIVRAYLELIGAKHKIGVRERMIANTYGATIADAMVSKMLTADQLTEILKTGKFRDADKIPSFAGVSALGNLKTGNILNLVGRLSIVQPVLLSIRISDTADPRDDTYAAIALHNEGLHWKLAGIDLPHKIIRDFAASLPVK